MGNLIVISQPASQSRLCKHQTPCRADKRWEHARVGAFLLFATVIFPRQRKDKTLAVDEWLYFSLK